MGWWVLFAGRISLETSGSRGKCITIFGFGQGRNKTCFLLLDAHGMRSVDISQREHEDWVTVGESWASGSDIVYMGVWPDDESTIYDGIFTKTCRSSTVAVL